VTVAVIGLGKLGLPLLALLAKSGHEVLGYDKCLDLRVKLINKQYDFHEPDLNYILASYDTNFHIVDTIEEAVQKSDVIFVIVPTPTDTTLRFSNHHIFEVIEKFSKVIKHKKQYCILNIVSTVMPNSSSEEFIPRIESQSGKKVNIDFGLTYNPEFIALGSVIQNMEFPDMHLIGSSDEASGKVVQNILQSIALNSAPSKIMSLTEAELVKISVNNFVTMKISFANMLMQLASKLESVDIDTVTSAIGLDSRIGEKYLRGGAAYGGPCFPRDTRAMGALFKDYLLVDALPNVVGEMNDSHNLFLAQEIAKIAKRNNSRNIGILGLSYKEDSQVLDDSPSIFISEYLVKLGLEIWAWDPMLDLMSNEIPTSIFVTESVEDLIRTTSLLVIPRYISPTHLNVILNWEKSLEIFDPWGQIGLNQNSLHQIFQPGRSKKINTK
jgi:UDPglucose 6-dehydrogenase